MNAEVTKAFVGFHGDEDFGLGLFVHCKTPNGEGMMEGRYLPVRPRDSKHHKDDTPLGEIIRGWLDATGVKRVDQMPGRFVRLELPESMSAVPIRVGHIVSDDLWFSTAAIMEEWGVRMARATEVKG